MGKKKKDETDLGKVVEDLLGSVGEDRDRLSTFLDDLLSKHGDEPAGIAEYVSKIADSLTKQNQLRIAAAKALGKVDPDGEDDDLTEEIGPAFAPEIDESAN